jgi:hypothetical protein
MPPILRSLRRRMLAETPASTDDRIVAVGTFVER